ncbi:MAG: hypothetical protein QNJ51_22330 [Calothrix sp. MO_167.B12]|nr:hypothetical protein [Calothrix sp. MO_167.B12]
MTELSGIYGIPVDDIKSFRREKGRFAEFRYCIAGSWQYDG